MPLTGLLVLLLLLLFDGPPPLIVGFDGRAYGKDDADLGRGKYGSVAAGAGPKGFEGVF